MPRLAVVDEQLERAEIDGLLAELQPERARISASPASTKTSPDLPLPERSRPETTAAKRRKRKSASAMPRVGVE